MDAEVRVDGEPAAAAAQGAGLKAPLRCHCMSLMRRTDWIWGSWAPNSAHSLYSPFSNRYWKPL